MAAGDAGGGAVSLEVPPRVGTWGTWQILVVARVAHVHTFRPLDLVVWFAYGWRTFLSGWCHFTLLRRACFKTTNTLRLAMHLEMP